MSGGRAFLVFCALGISACGPSPKATEPTASATAEPPPPPPGPPEPEKVETGHDCATAEAVCDGGVCTMKFKNGCEKPLTCDAFMGLRCQAGTDIIEAKGRGQKTFPAKTDGELHVTANCTTGSIVQSSITDLTCK